MTRDQDDVSLCLCHARCNRADAGRRHELHADARGRIDLLQVIDELGQILDRVDVVVWRWRNQRHAGCRVPEFCDEFRHLEAGQLPALAGLGALGHLDLDLAALVEVLGRHAEASGGNLLDGRVRVVAVWPGLESRGIFAALARVRLRTDPVHGDVQRAMGFRGQCAKGHAGRHEALRDFGNRFDVFGWYRRAVPRPEIHQVTQACRR